MTWRSVYRDQLLSPQEAAVHVKSGDLAPAQELISLAAPEAREELMHEARLRFWP